jgi:long-subunit fatty acid transport protein
MKTKLIPFLFFKRKIVISFSALFLLLNISYCQQYAFDALKFSFPYQTGTARFVGMGGAMGALGADVSCIANNPAGLGLMRNTEFSVSPAMFFNFTESDYENVKYSEDKFVFNVGSIGAVYSKHYNKDKTTGVQFLNFGLSYQRTNNFNNNVFFTGIDSVFSMAQSFTDAAQGFTPNVLHSDFEQLALNTQLIDTVGNNSSYENLGLMNNQVKGFSRQNLNSGSTGDILLSGAINLGNKLYIGTSFSISILNYKRENNYSETDINNLNTRFHQLNFKEVIDVSGLGVNVKVGVIYKPIDWFRVGFAFHTPTWYGISEDSYAELTTNLNFGQFKSRSSTQLFDYTLATPWRMQGSLGFLPLKKLAIGLEYEFADYTNMNLRPSSNEFLAENNYIDTVFSASHIIRIGTELKLDPFKIRVGYNFQSDPFKKTALLTNAFHNLSLGGGFKMVIGRNKKRERYWVFDLTYLVTLTSGQISANNYAAIPRYAQLKTGMHHVIGTVGFQF